MRQFRHFTWKDRIRLETMLRDGLKPKEIASRLGFHISTIYRERKRGEYMHRTTHWIDEPRYSADASERKYRYNLSAKGQDLKISNDREFAEFIEDKIINDKYSPYAALQAAFRLSKFVTKICVSTLYSYIDKGIFARLTNKYLPYRHRKKQVYKRIKAIRELPGDSIEVRPAIVEARKEFGHWEMDTVKGTRARSETLLVLTERSTRQEIAIKMPANTKLCVVNALDMLERKYDSTFSATFKTITVDNGSEFADYKGIQRSCLRARARTQLYNCHPYSSWERGSNENQNKLIRRWIPKSTRFEEFSHDFIAKIQDWINNYPRKLFNGRTSNDLVFAVTQT